MGRCLRRALGQISPASACGRAENGQTKLHCAKRLHYIHIGTVLSRSKGRGIPVLYQSARQPADQPESGVADHPQSRRGNRAGRTHQLSFPAQNIWLSCMETGRFPGYANDDLQPFVLSDHKTLSWNRTGRKRRRVLPYKIIENLIRSILKSISCAKGFSLPQYFVRISKNKKYTKISKKGLSPW